ncbi:hypothetical protein [Kitasatospora sp. NPDC090091]|uniref:hypothetical protein n=1 Tax=Kitasatospora sp. NPDC090091 TaxID=3364081 RepID=UPI003816E5BE
MSDVVLGVADISWLELPSLVATVLGAALAINLERDLLELVDVPERPARAVPVDGYLW